MFGVLPIAAIGRPSPCARRPRPASRSPSARSRRRCARCRCTVTLVTLGTCSSPRTRPGTPSYRRGAPVTCRPAGWDPAIPAISSRSRRAASMPARSRRPAGSSAGGRTPSASSATARPRPPDSSRRHRPPERCRRRSRRAGPSPARYTPPARSKCWGRNFVGQLGDGTNTSRTSPTTFVNIPGGRVAIAAGGAHACALTTGGQVYCWGRNSDGQLGSDGTNDNNRPVRVFGFEQGVAIAAGSDHTCAITAGGAAQCWGDNFAGKLGREGTGSQLYHPADVTNLASGAATIAPGWSHSCAVTTGGAAKCWGDNFAGQVGDGSITQRRAPVDVVGLGGGVAGDLGGVRPRMRRNHGGRGQVLGRQPLGRARRRLHLESPHAGRRRGRSGPAP